MWFFIRVIRLPRVVQSRFDCPVWHRSNVASADISEACFFASPGSFDTSGDPDAQPL
jgi:hypothetical protein